MTILLRKHERISSKGRTLRVTDLDLSSLAAMRPVLIAMARRRSTIAYGELKAAAELPHTATGMGRLLDLVKVDCVRRREPDLAALVVNANTHEVGDEYGTGAAGERERVYQHWR